MQYKGLLNVIERNAAEHRAVLGGKAQETRGQGTAEATVTLVLAEDGRRHHPRVPSAPIWRCPARPRPWARA